MKHEESRIIIALFEWFKLKHRKNAFAWLRIEQGGKRSAREAHYIQLEGLTPGVSDIFIAMPIGGFSGLWLEMKTRKNSLTNSQRAFLGNMSIQGYACAVGYGYHAGVAIINDYLGAVFDQGPMLKHVRKETKGRRPYT